MKRRNIFKRSLSMFLAFVMCLGVLQVTAFAKTVEATRTCTTPVHTHGADCYGDPELICGKVAAVAHAHGESCYTTTTEKALTCGLEESDGTPAVEGHTHIEDCYDGETLICGQDESEGTPAVEGHTHDDSCHGEKEVKTLTCGLDEVAEADSHEHTDDCYRASTVLVCGKEEHTHDATCYEVVKYSDLETALNDTEDNEIELILRGTTLVVEDGKNIELSNGKTLTIKDDESGEELVGGKIVGSNGNYVIIVNQGATLTLSGSTVITHDAKNSHTIDKETGVHAYQQGNGKSGGGVEVNGGTFNMEGGVITDNRVSAEDMYRNDGSANGNYKGVGAGVYVHGNGTFNLSGGTISNNAAGEGGGIYIGSNTSAADTSVFTMTGGTVTGNVALKGEGGGIYIRTTGKDGGNRISAGDITNNATLTTKDLGGGGIYIESDAGLQITNAVIINNTAKGFGGGLSACVHGETVIGVQDGAIICMNSAGGEARAKGYSYTDGSNYGWYTDGYNLWNAGNRQDDLKDASNDIFTASSAKDTNDQGTPGIVVCTEMLNGIKPGWTGIGYQIVTSGKDLQDAREAGNWFTSGSSGGGRDSTKEKIYYKIVELRADDNGSLVISSEKINGLTAHVTPEEEAQIYDFVESVTNRVLISGNYSAVHGGGIGNNGKLNIGTASSNEIKALDTGVTLNATKHVDDVDGLAVAEDKQYTIQDNDFTFVIKDEAGNVLHYAKNKGRNVVLNFPSELFADAKPNGETTYTFYVSEQVPENQGNFQYDSTEYRVTIKVTAVTVKDEDGDDKVYKVGNDEIKVQQLTPSTPVVEKKVVVDGAETWMPVEDIEKDITFNNTYDPKDYDFTLTKTDAETGETIKADSAEFQLWYVKGEETVYLKQVMNDDGEFVFVETTEPTTIKTNATGTFKGLSSMQKDKVYYLQEVKAPAGYTVDPTIYTIGGEGTDNLEALKEMVVDGLNAKIEELKKDSDTVDGNAYDINTATLKAVQTQVDKMIADNSTMSAKDLAEYVIEINTKIAELKADGKSISDLQKLIDDEAAKFAAAEADLETAEAAVEKRYEAAETEISNLKNERDAVKKQFDALKAAYEASTDIAERNSMIAEMEMLQARADELTFKMEAEKTSYKADPVHSAYNKAWLAAVDSKTMHNAYVGSLMGIKESEAYSELTKQITDLQDILKALKDAETELAKTPNSAELKALEDQLNEVKLKTINELFKTIGDLLGDEQANWMNTLNLEVSLENWKIGKEVTIDEIAELSIRDFELVDVIEAEFSLTEFANFDFDIPEPETPPTPEDPPTPPTPEDPPTPPTPETPDEPTTPPSPETPEPEIDIPDNETPLTNDEEEAPEDENVEIEDIEVPLDEMEEEEEEEELIDILDDDVPLADIPATGDDSAVWTMMVLASAAGLLCLMMIERKKRQMN